MLPGERIRTSQLPLAVLDVNNQEHDAQSQHDAADDDVTNAQKLIFASKQGCGRNDDPFGARKILHRIICDTRILTLFRVLKMTNYHYYKIATVVPLLYWILRL